jgi:hypothetical protein
VIDGEKDINYQVNMNLFRSTLFIYNEMRPFTRSLQQNIYYLSARMSYNLMILYDDKNISSSIGANKL